METREQRPLIGIAWMLLTGLCFVGVNVIVKHVGGDIPAPQAAFIRFVAGLVFLAPVFLRMFREPINRKMLPLLAYRGIFHTIAVMAWFFAMARIPLAEATAIGYVNPVFVTIGAALFLGEKLAARRLIAIAAALIGVLIILRPGFRDLNLGHYAQVLAAISFAISFIFAKRLASQVSPSAIIAILALVVTIGLAPFAAAVWVTPTLTQVLWLTLVAGFATAGHYAMARAFAEAPVGVTQPVTYLQIIWAVLFGILLFDEPVDIWVLVGASVIIGAVSFISWRESRLKRQAVTPVDPATKV